MTDLPPVVRALEELHIPYRLFVQTGLVHSLEQAAREPNQLPDQVIRSIMFRVGSDLRRALGEVEWRGRAKSSHGARRLAAPADVCVHTTA